MYFFECVKYVVLIGILGFIFGMLLPKNMFSETKYPFRPFDFENNGKYYEKFKIKKWKDKLPDMSKIFPKLVPTKFLSEKTTHSRKDALEKFTLLVKETCIAEFVHLCLCFAGLYCMRIWAGIGGFVCSMLNVIGNIPFIMVQRYNRPRLVAIASRNSQQKSQAAEVCSVQ